MSEGPRIPYKTALVVAEQFIHQLKPACERIEIAGSLRRKKETVGDIEIVCIPRRKNDLLGELFFNDTGILFQLTQMGISWLMIKKNGQHLKQLVYRGIIIELYITTPIQWGIIFLLRTGCAEFSTKMVTPRNKGGLMPSNLRVREGLVWNGDQVLESPEEEDVFRIYGMNWIEPENRI